ncbi:hypothetical protein [Sorangium sp. So ce362]|uniref:hypothetical protein n=1 Tax=Sorangium sp. So ce362 TaxID=3133303 RepID=UPI003F5E6053
MTTQELVEPFIQQGRKQGIGWTVASSPGPGLGGWAGVGSMPPEGVRSVVTPSQNPWRCDGSRRFGAAEKSRQDSAAVANGRDPSLLAGFRGGATTDRRPSDGMDPTLAQPRGFGSGELAMVEPSPRAAVVASLAGTLSRAVALGDEEAARVVHEAIGQLLGLSVAPEG